MKPIPNLTASDIAFGNIKHLPKWEEIPDEFKNFNKETSWNKLIDKWFFFGLTEEDTKKLKPKEGIDKDKALAAIKAILASWEPKHEHKKAGTAYLMSEWFEE